MSTIGPMEATGLVYRANGTDRYDGKMDMNHRGAEFQASSGQLKKEEENIKRNVVNVAKEPEEKKVNKDGRNKNGYNKSKDKKDKNRKSKQNKNKETKSSGLLLDISI